MKDGRFEADDFCVPFPGIEYSNANEICFDAAEHANALLPTLKEQWREEMLKDATECDACGKTVITSATGPNTVADYQIRYRREDRP